ncbi:MAG TPA: glycosyltransferase family 39 protein [Rhizomicrobium sp.]
MTAKTFDWRQPSVLLALLTVGIHLLVNGRYGFFRDELYFIVCGRHPAWGYVDQPPLIPLLAAGSRALFGDFLIGFRLVPMLAMAATVALTAEFAKLNGGGRFAQWLAGLCTLFAAMFLTVGLIFTTDTFQALTWLGCAWCLVRLEQSGDQRWWLGFGAIAGVGLFGKYIVAFYLAALAAGLLFTPLRRSLGQRWVYLGVALMLAIILPNLLWQISEGWPFLELGKAGAGGKNLALSPLDFLSQQLLLIGPLAAPVWIAGLWAGFVRPRLKVWRAFAIAYGLLFAIFIVIHGKAYYLSSIYPVVLGVGAVVLEGWLTRATWRALALGAVTVTGVLIAPMAVPVLSEANYLAYARALGVAPSATASEHQRLGLLPQHFADMHGWPQMAAKVAAVWRALPPDERARAVFFGQNYGEAAAIDVFGAGLGLPRAIGGHNNYYLWGPRGHDGSVVIAVGGDVAEYRRLFRSVTVAGATDDPYAMPYENRPIYVLRGMNPPLQTYWPKVKHYE